MRVQQSNGSVQLYDNATIEVVGKTLQITTANGKGTLVINDAACSYVEKLMRCLPYHYVLQQNGTHQLDFEHGTIYYNPTQTKQQMTFSSTQLEPEGVLIAVKSKKGTYVTITGTLDGRKP
ncbi:MAG: hypothetical protein ACXVAC_18985 [Vulcanimicrobiaceae bacterium]